MHDRWLVQAMALTAASQVIQFMWLDHGPFLPLPGTVVFRSLDEAAVLSPNWHQTLYMKQPSVICWCKILVCFKPRCQNGACMLHAACLQSSICTELIKRLLDNRQALTAAAAVIAELDCLCSFALVARELGYCRPVLTQDNVLHIKGGEA